MVVLVVVRLFAATADLWSVDLWPRGCRRTRLRCDALCCAPLGHIARRSRARVCPRILDHPPTRPPCGLDNPLPRSTAIVAPTSTSSHLIATAGSRPSSAGGLWLLQSLRLPTCCCC